MTKQLRRFFAFTIAAILVVGNSYTSVSTASVAAASTSPVTVTLSGPKTVHGSSYDHYLVGQANLTGQYENTALNTASTFEVTEQTWGFDESQLSRFFSATNRTGVRLESYDYQPHTLKLLSSTQERNWDFWSSIASDGSNDGDIVRYFVVTSDGIEHNVAEAEIWTGMVKIKTAPGIKIFVINPFSPELNLLEPPAMMGRYIVPMVKPAGNNIVRTEPIFIAWDMAAMNSGSAIFGCARAGVEIKRLTGPGHVSVVLDANVVKRPGPITTGNGILFGAQGGTYNGGSAECPDAFTGQAVCFRTTQYWLGRVNNLPGGSIHVMGYPHHMPTSYADGMSLLLGSQHHFVTPTAVQVLNAQWAAHQLSYAQANGSVIPGYSRGQLGLYGLNWHQVVALAPYSVTLAGSITLANGVQIDRFSTIETLQSQVRLVGTHDDALKLAAVLKLLNAYCRS